jgi:preprotein translocase subunit SecE
MVLRMRVGTREVELMSRVTEFSDEEERPQERDEPEGGKRTLGFPTPKLGWGKRLSTFYQDVKMELRKTSWPTRNEVWSTTLVVMIAIVFFGFYLWGVDRLVTLGFEWLEQAVR